MAQTPPSNTAAIYRSAGGQPVLRNSVITAPFTLVEDTSNQSGAHCVSPDIKLV